MKDLIITAALTAMLALGVSAQSHPKRTAAKIPAAGGSISVEVEGGKKLALAAADLAKLSRTDITAKDHDGTDAAYSGVELRVILAAAGAKFGKELKGAAVGQYLVIEAADGYHAVFSLTELDPDFADKVVILADKKDGRPLDEKSGPYQIIASGEKKHARWVRRVTALRVLLAK